MPRAEPPRGVRAITSLQNDRVKLIRALEMRKARRETGLFTAEGASVLVMARDAGWVPRMLVFLAGSARSGIAQGLLAWAEAAGAECLEVSEAVLGKLTAKDNPQAMLGVFEQRWAADARADRDGVCVALEAIRDPGNLGTIIRTADAAGARGVLLIGNSADPYSREAVRASMGSIFNMAVARMSPEGALALAAAWPGDVVGAGLGATADFRAVSYREPTLLVMGSEGPGLSAELAAVCTRLVKIPMAGSLDSLNLAVATALMLYEIRRAHLHL
ncbi:MAG TPA: RNA methyltransferase [Hyphomicrobiaceae bacterium]|nr:RNA methyltransferase [Hyphomicrobiaceae bacterium]